MTSQQCVVFLRKMAGRRWLPYSWRNAFAWSAECISTFIDNEMRLQNELAHVNNQPDKLKAENAKLLEERNRLCKDYDNIMSSRTKEYFEFTDRLNRIVAIANEEMK